MSYALKGNDRIVMWEISPVATTALLLAFPLGTAVEVRCATRNVLERRYRLDVPCLTLVATLVLLRFTAQVAKGQIRILGTPGAGLIILLMATPGPITITIGARLQRWSLLGQPWNHPFSEATIQVETPSEGQGSPAADRICWRIR